MGGELSLPALIKPSENKLRKRNSSLPGWKKKLRWFLPSLELLGALLSVPRVARANSGYNFYETVGISTAAGTVLGASTLPFYSQPGNQLINLVYGAALGAATGLGIWFYGWASGSSDERSPDAHISKRLQLKVFAQSSQCIFVAQAHDSTFIQASETKLADPPGGLKPVGVAYPALLWMPVVSLTW